MIICYCLNQKDLQNNGTQLTALTLNSSPQKDQLTKQSHLKVPVECPLDLLTTSHGPHEHIEFAQLILSTVGT